VPQLITGGQGDPADRGDADPAAAVALRAFASGQGSEHAALSALASARLLIPVVAVLTEPAAPADQPVTGGRASAPGPRPASALRREKASEMALPTLIGQDGRTAVLAFTGLPALLAWRPDTRPVPVPAGQVWRAAAGTADAVVIDVAGPVPLAVEGARLAALAAGQPVPPPHEDPDVHAEVRAATAAEPAIAGFSLAPAREVGTDLAVTLRLASPGPRRAKENGPAVNRAAAGIATRLAARLRRGIEVIVAG